MSCLFPPRSVGFLTALLLFGNLSGAGAADLSTASSQIEQARQSNVTAPTLFPNTSLNGPGDVPSYTPESPADEDLGQQIILKRKLKDHPFSFFAESDYTHTTNAALTDRSKVDDWIWRSAVGAGYQGRIGGELFGSFSVSQEFFRYNNYSELDFSSLNLGAGLSYNLWFLQNITANLQFNYNRLAGDDYSEDLFTNRTISLGLARNFILSRAHYFYAGASALVGWSNPDRAARNEYAAYLGYHVRVARNFDADLFYRVAYNDYTDVDRADFNHTLELSLRYNFTKWLTASATVNAAKNDSDRTGFDYEVLNTGAGLSLNWRF